jgi:GTP-binding protein LepA
VDFTYEVSRALEACEGAILVVDAAQGIEAQTISNLLLAMELDLEIIPVLNKVDLPGANPEAVASTIENLIGEPAENIARISAKTGEGVQERLDREFGLDIITTVPNVKYRVNKNDDAWVNVENPSNMPPVGDIQEIHEPIVKAEIITPTEYIGGLMQLCQDRRGVYINTQYLDEERVSLEYHLPLAEIVFDYYDKLKSISRGYASLDYDYLDYRTSHLVKLDVMINGDAVDALSTIVHRDKAYEMGRKLVKKLRELIPRQMFDVALQAAVGSRIISRETVKALRKDVTAKCYGGDISRKRKLLEKQKKGKKRMKQVGSVEVPQEAFLAVLSMDD